MAYSVSPTGMLQISNPATPTVPRGFSVNPAAYTRVGGMSYVTSENAKFANSFDSVAGEFGIKRIGYRNAQGLRISKTRVGVDISVREDERLKQAMKRLNRAPRRLRTQLKRNLRKIVRQEFLNPLKRNIPQRKGKKVQRIAKGTKIHRTKRGRTEVYGKKKHIRQTARISKVEPERIVVTVGSADLWYGAALHARVPFFPITIRQVQARLDRAITKEMYAMMDYLAKGRRRSF